VATRVKWINGQPVTVDDSLGAAAAIPSSIQNRFTPWQPPPIPSGYYDPSLDAQRQSASRGLLNTEQDVGLAGRRATEDYGLDVGDVERGFGRGIEDIGTQRRYTDEDYTTNVALLTRQYGQQARQQAEVARKYGVTSGGIALMSAAKRAENQALEQGNLNRGYARTVEGLDTTGRRLGEDRSSSLGRLQLGYDRGVADRGTALSRARSEDLFYGLDVDQQKLYQAQAAGYAAPQRPANEFVRPDGTVVRTVRRDGYVYVYDQSGKVIEKRKAA
jgi:hypothetical protein